MSMAHKLPEFRFGDTSNIKPHKADAKLLERLNARIGFKPPVGIDKVSYFKKKLLEEYESNRNVKLAVETCVHCGACLTACPTYITTGDIRNSPVGRAELIRAVIKAEKPSGKLLGKAVNAVKAIDENYLEMLYTYYWQCLLCRKCATICPFGVDQASLTRTVRSILYELGMASRFVVTTIDNMERTGNNMALTPAAIRNILEFVINEIKQEKGVEIKVKIDQPAYALLLPSSADFFMNIETLKGHLLFMHAIGMDYTISTKLLEVANFGLFLDPRHLKYIGEMYVNAARELGVKLAVFCECGHGWHAFKNYVIPRLREYGIEGLHIFHLVVDAIRRGRIKLNPEANGDIVYMYQDPDYYARGGDLTEEPRFIMNHVVKKWVDSEYSRGKTWCCGGQGGMLADEMLPLAIQYARLWYEDALKHGAQWVVRPCSICKAQLSHVVPHLNKMYGKEIKYSGLMDLVYRALVV
ncbi:(Fe-S)-binding protein [Vulcanisaeta distributa]|uniref:4Fe-4S ferredoxin iron-sulfur binding domain protein n=1 Tax=Vulcanisaeta distributa (strain DSM 14429 / JCM 11212 / NBRC 100878 / IC-017) TaxID=572478 RepID=E1QPH4_VULDI|nr:(Fe-S)-binding protein [Vulcanisaeta distributa]ADN51462.1 4Fe-4S ferredoxin iron-sulfur binding domain protein [Vulcanisaeta distributa DSM 14429]